MVYVEYPTPFLCTFIAYDDDDARLRSLHSNSSRNVNNVKRLKVFIIPEEPKPIWQRKGGRRPKYVTEEERLKAKSERERQRREKIKREQPEMHEELRRKRREATRKKDPLKRKEELAKRREYHRQRQKRIQQDPEKHEELKRRRREYNKRRREENPEKHSKQRRERRRKLKEEDPQKYEQYRMKERMRCQRNPNRKRTDEMEEEKEMKKMRRKSWYRKQMETKEGREMIRFRQYSRLQMRLAQMTDEELAELKAKRSEAAKKWRENLTGEKLEKYRTYLRNNAKKYNEKCLATMGEAYKKVVNARYRNYVANETPEQRQRRLRRYQINQAIIKLRKQLEEIGVPPEEVERRVTELKKTMEGEPLPPPETLSKYKARVKSELNFSFPPRRTDGVRKGRPPGSSRQMDTNNEAFGNSNDQTGVNDSNDFDHQRFIDDDVNEQINTDASNEPALEPVPILHFDNKCPHCSSTYSERSDLISHISSEHSKICWKCPKCKLIVLSSDELSDHYKKEHFSIRNTSTETTNSTNETTSSKKNNIFTCIKCHPLKSSSETTFGSVKELMEHVMFNHFESYWPCSKCNLLKYTKSSLKLHEKICKTDRKNKLN